MLKTIAVIFVIIVVGIAGILAFAATKPDTFRSPAGGEHQGAAREDLSAPQRPAQLRGWSPYEKKDPAMKRTYSGAPSGKGAVYEWDGDKNVGRGRLAIADSSPPSKVTLDLDMLAPLKAHNIVVFTLEPKGDSTNVTWAMNGQVPYIAKIVHVFLDVDKMVGQDFEAGLANLKAIAEK